MDEIEGYLQCFDEEDCEYLRYGTKDYKLPDELEDVIRVLLWHAIMIRDQRILYLLIDNGIKKHLSPRVSSSHYFFDEIIRLLYDCGITQYRVITSDVPKLQRFLRRRECVRKAAIAMMGCVGKDVGRIIGRAIWASRGIKEWIS